LKIEGKKISGRIGQQKEICMKKGKSGGELWGGKRLKKRMKKKNQKKDNQKIID